MYRDIIFFNNGDMIFKHISDISIYIIRVSHIDLFVRLTSLNTHEHCMFQNQNAARWFIWVYLWREPTVFRIVLMALK